MFRSLSWAIALFVLLCKLCLLPLPCPDADQPQPIRAPRALADDRVSRKPLPHGRGSESGSRNFRHVWHEFHDTAGSATRKRGAAADFRPAVLLEQRSAEWRRESAPGSTDQNRTAVPFSLLFQCLSTAFPRPRACAWALGLWRHLWLLLMEPRQPPSMGAHKRLLANGLLSQRVFRRTLVPTRVPTRQAKSLRHV